ncbi:dihydrolipoyl dehydrogenase [Clostridium ganghwense]|uniref:Dihydrolipoyl dehydrogenase n=1 Tax=Clostridium ganghwense TaxID=312089 RepID=A0ABT4CPP1_9CLOT|nr:dihydrolipoyl dehydrogenase [Clostridium ganghwense]MCY6371020.1 dihydrolipoyl dehydrogenase [Clostridium ganghwense]
MDKDIVVIGGGPGGYTAAIRAAQLGGRVCLIEKDRLGGTCLNRGCIPTKALYRNAEILNTLKNTEKFGINIHEYKINVDKIMKRKQGIVDKLVSGVELLLKRNGVEVIEGTASILDRNTVLVKNKKGEEIKISTKNIIIATGSKATSLPIEGAYLSEVMKSEEILNLTKIPKDLIIIGGGVIGMEFAAIFNSMGAKVSVIEALPNILSSVDREISKRFSILAKKKGIKINISTKVCKIEKSNEELIVYAEGKKGKLQFKGDTVLISVGRIPLTEGLNLEKTEVEFTREGIKVDSNFETNVKGIYAIGDVNGKCMLAHAAAHQGIAAVENIMGVRSQKKNNLIPSCIFVFPEIASIGITEEEAKLKKIDYKVSKFSFGANGKALALGEEEGMVKVIGRKDDNRIIGVHIMGPHASDLIHEGALAVSKKMKVEDIKEVIHAHPTLSEAFYESVMGLQGEAIHMLNKTS